MTEVLFLFDVDGTLLDTKGAGVIPFCESVSTITGNPVDFDRNQFRGLTDHQIARFLLAESKLDSQENIEKTILTYEKKLVVALENSPAVALPGTYKALSKLRNRSKIGFVAATGNTKQGLKIKLHSAQLDEVITVSYCSEIQDKARSDILKRAKGDFPDAQIIVVGDTPKDAQAAREIGADFAAVINPLYSKESALSDLAKFLVPHPWDETTFLQIASRYIPIDY